MKLTPESVLHEDTPVKQKKRETSKKGTKIWSKETGGTYRGRNV